MASDIYSTLEREIANGSVDLDSDTIEVMLVSSGYASDQDADDNQDDVTNEATGTGYTAGGATLANKVVATDNTENDGYFDPVEVTW